MLFKIKTFSFRKNYERYEKIFPHKIIHVKKLYKFTLLSKSESVKFSLIESVICLFTDSSVKKYFSLSNQSIFTEVISKT